MAGKISLLTANHEKYHKLERNQRLVDTRLAFGNETHFLGC